MSNPTTPFSWQMPTATDLVTDLPADFEVFGQAVATSMADLLGGASGYILSKASATDMDFTWIANDQGDITGVTATTPLTGGGSSGAITVGIQDALTTQKGAVQLSDSTSTTSSILAATPTAVKSAFDTATTANTTANAAIPKSTVTTNGDLIYGTGSAAVTRLGIGSTSQVLTVAGGVPTWAAPASGGGLTLLSTTSLTGASVTISSISGSYKNLKLFIKLAYATVGDDIKIRLNGDTGSNYNFSRVRNIANTLSGSNGVNLDYIYLTGALTTNNTDKEKAFVLVDIPRYTDTDIQEVAATAYSYPSGGVTYFACNGVYDKTAAITSITLLMGSGNFSGGTAYLYGES